MVGALQLLTDLVLQLHLALVLLPSLSELSLSGPAYGFTGQICTLTATNFPSTTAPPTKLRVSPLYADVASMRCVAVMKTTPP